MHIKKIYICSILILACPSALYTSWFNFWQTRADKIKSDQLCGKTLKEVADKLKADHNEDIKKTKKESNSMLLDELNNPQLSSFFTESKFSLNRPNIFQVSEIITINKNLLNMDHAAESITCYKNLPNSISIHFEGNILNNKRYFYIYLMERIGTKKKFYPKIIGQENDDRSFSWTKLIDNNDTTASLQSKKNNKHGNGKIVTFRE